VRKPTSTGVRVSAVRRRVRGGDLACPGSRGRRPTGFDRGREESGRRHGAVRPDRGADNPDVQVAATAVESAWIALRRTSIHAPVSGYVAKRPVQLGERTTSRQSHDLHRAAGALRVEANFKEVQLNRMRIGQPVKIVADLYGGEWSTRGRSRALGWVPAPPSRCCRRRMPRATGSKSYSVAGARGPRPAAAARTSVAHRSCRPVRPSTCATTPVPNSRRLPRKEPVLNTDIYAIDISEITARIAQIIADNAPAGCRPRQGRQHPRPKSPRSARSTSNGNGRQSRLPCKTTRCWFHERRRFA
jgi:membrane fusion protein (multidrug efflux system)